MEKNLNSEDSFQHQKNNSSFQPETVKLPVVEESVSIDTRVIETGKVIVKKRVVQEDVDINIPLKNEVYATKRVAVDKQVFDKAPLARHEDGNIIIPIIREIAVITIKYEVEEELHIIQTRTEVPLVQQVTLAKEEVTVERIPLNKQ
ncbi:MAG: DUF2382 domain-containing protein [Ferruginibacter sp.]